MRRALVATAVLLAGCSTQKSSPATAHAPVTSAAAPVSSGTVPPPPPPPVLLAGAARVDVTPPVGVPLAGYGGGARRHGTPNFAPNAYDHFLVASTGVRDPICARALFVTDGKTPIAIVTLDAIATTDEIVQAVHAKARALGSTVPLENLMVCASHTHSGPGCLTTLWLWELAAVDLYQDSVFGSYTDGVAHALVEAERNAQPATIAAGSGQLANATHNRRAGVSPTFTSSSIDPELLVLRIDSRAGAPIATLWNFAIHGVSLDDTNLSFSADIMGGADAALETRTGAPALFVNSAEGDISPGWFGDSGIKTGGPILADAVMAVRGAAAPIAAPEVAATSETVDFGQPAVDLSKVGSVASLNGFGSALQVLGGIFGLALPLPQGSTEHAFRFQALRIGKCGFASIPGEAIHTIGLDLKAHGSALGYEHVFTCGLANGHMAYICTEPEYNAGGYEALLTFFGSKTADKLEASSEARLDAVKP